MVIVTQLQYGIDFDEKSQSTSMLRRGFASVMAGVACASQSVPVQ